MIYKITDTKITEPLFYGSTDTVITSCLEGVMGTVYANDDKNPTSAFCYLADFLFFGGKPDYELIEFIPQVALLDEIITVPDAEYEEEWLKSVEKVFGDKCSTTVRYGLKKESGIFDLKNLQGIVDSLPPEYSLKPIDEDIYGYAMKNEWCHSWVSQYPTYGFYAERGLGVAILKDGEIVSGASSYSAYSGGIEVEIITRPDYRRRGLALVCGAALILEAEKRGLYASWDAKNYASKCIAEKLGYHFSGKYPVCEVSFK